MATTIFDKPLDGELAEAKQAIATLNSNLTDLSNLFDVESVGVASGTGVTANVSPSRPVGFLLVTMATSVATANTALYFYTTQNGYLILSALKELSGVSATGNRYSITFTITSSFGVNIRVIGFA